METKFYRLTCLTELHMGDGSDNYSVIDNEVAKDPVTGYPIMVSSGIKGAIREYAAKEKRMDAARITHLFGTAIESKGSAKEQGSVRFLSGRMLARPVQASEGNKPFYMVTTSTALQELVDQWQAMKNAVLTEVPEGEFTIGLKERQVGIDGHTVKESDCGNAKWLELLGVSSLISQSDAVFRNIPLPVTAHNCLEDGISKNLWYDEDVPARSVFWMAVQGSANDLDELDRMLNGAVVQFGGDASVGKGLCKLSAMG